MYNYGIVNVNCVWYAFCHNTVPDAAPPNLQVQNISANELFVAWERPNEININGVLDQYDIAYFINGSLETLQNVTVASGILNTTLRSLNNYTIYNVSVAAITIGRGPIASMLERTSENGTYYKSGESGKSYDYYYYYYTFPVPGEAPLNVFAMNASSTSIQVDWDPPRPEFTFGILRHFIIRYAVANESETFNTTDFSTTDFNTTELIPASDISFTIQGLLEFTNYSVAVAAITVGRGPYSPPFYVITDQDSMYIHVQNGLHY